MTSFYKCEIEGTVPNTFFDCYAKAEYFPNKGESKSNADLKVENELIKYFDDNLSSSFGDISCINIMDINPEEYYGMKKSNRHIYLI